MELETSQIKSILFDILLSPLEGENPTASPDERKNAARIRKIAECWDGSKSLPPEIKMLINQHLPCFKGIENFEKKDELSSESIEKGLPKPNILKMISEYSFALKLSDIAEWVISASYIEAMTLAALATGNPLSTSHEANNIRESALIFLKSIPNALKICRAKPTRSLLRALNDFPGIPQNIAQSMVEDFLTPGERVGIFDPWRW